MAQQTGFKRRLTISPISDSESPQPKKMKFGDATKDNYVPISQKEQLTRKEIAKRLHFESFNDENTKVFTKNDQLSLLNKKQEKFGKLDKKIEDLSKQKNYKKTGRGMMNMLNDLCDLEENDSDLDEEYHRKRDKKRMEVQRILRIDEKCEMYDGKLKNVEWTKRVKVLTIEYRERALSKILQIIKQNYSNLPQGQQQHDEERLEEMSIQCEVNVCKRANSDIEYGKYVRDQLHDIRELTKTKALFEIEIESDEENEAEDESGSESESEDDDLPISVRLKTSPSLSSVN